ncbi:hypothetical protein VP01_5432g1 [Puccinia sorghi]|uniref:Uncharacterized protein n=1 Tax=Puccinia sorghi TaxID=27349 RepID=A0A0L6UKF1_9BASI|nr:hypothetical protein VP01_5432g1 [Puccinia sorghi]
MLVCTLKRKFIHAFSRRKHNSNMLDKILTEPNKHVEPWSNFSYEFFLLQWQLQVNFESQKHTDNEIQENLARFFERDNLFVVATSTESTQLYSTSILQKIRNLQISQSTEAAEIGGEFGDLNPRDKEQQHLKILLWNAKSALFKAAVELQAETQPLRASKERGERVGTLLKEKIYAAIKRRKPGVIKAIQTFCKPRPTYLTSYAPAEREWPQNQDFDYSDFMKMGLDDPFWNNGFLCLSRDPWAVDPVVRTGIHAMLGLDQSNKELMQLKIELWLALSWELSHLKKLGNYINKTVQCKRFHPYVHHPESMINQNFPLPGDEALNPMLLDVYGDANIPGVKKTPGGKYLLLGGNLFISQVQHIKILRNWHKRIKQMIYEKVITYEAVLTEWFTTMQKLLTQDNVVANPTDDLEQAPNENTNEALDLALEDVALDDHDYDGEQNEGPLEEDVITDDEAE